MIRRNRLHREILAQLLARLDPVGQQAWPLTDACAWGQRRVPADVSTILEDLAATFGQQSLVELGIVQEEEGQPPASRLAPAAVLLPLADVSGGLPFDALATGGLLLGAEVPAYAAVHDVQNAAAMRSSNGLLLMVPTIEDVLLCRALGLAAAPVAALETLPLAGLRQIESLSRRPDRLALPSEQDEPAVGGVTADGRLLPDFDGQGAEAVPSREAALRSA